MGNYDALGDEAIIRIVMGDYLDYFKPVNGETLVSMLTSFHKHLWSPSLEGPFVAPLYYNAHLGGSRLNWPTDTVPGDNRTYLTFWGGSAESGGAAHLTDGDVGAWGRPFTMALITADAPNIPEPSAAVLLVLGLLTVRGPRQSHPRKLDE